METKELLSNISTPHNIVFIKQRRRKLIRSRQWGEWRKFEHFGRIDQLRYYGRELLGVEIEWTEKRDGKNISFFYKTAKDETHHVQISQRNFENLDPSIDKQVQAAKNLRQMVRMCMHHPYWTIYTELMGPEKQYESGKWAPTRGPTQIEMPKKVIEFIVVAIWDHRENAYLHYNLMHQECYHYKLPVVKLVDRSVSKTEEELMEQKFKMMKWCKKHHREGVVGRALFESGLVMFKEKIDLPIKSKTLARENMLPQFPPMPEDAAFRAIGAAIQKCIDHGDSPRDQAKAMPLVAQHLQAQGREHYWSVPRKMFPMYLDFLKKHLHIDGNIYTLKDTHIYLENSKE